MGLVVLKDQGYHEYQDRMVHKARKAVAQRSESHRRSRRHRLLRRTLASGLSFATLTAALFVTFFVFYSYLGLFSGSSVLGLNTAPMRAAQRAAPLVLSQEPARADNPVWKCADTFYTNAPGSEGVCEYLGNVEANSDSMIRFITPSAPSNS
jgi:hypothetical protein